MADRWLLKDKIWLLADAGLDCKQIANVLEVEAFSVTTVLRRYTPRKKQPRDDIRQWLLINWRFVIPKRNFTRRKGTHSEFRTPYNYPRMWHKEE